MLGALALAVTSRLWAPPMLRQLPGFGVARAEVSGTRLLAPHEVLAASGIRMGASVWTDPAAWEAALRRNPVIAHAEVTRDLPHTLRVRVTEKRPVALVEGRTLQPVTAEGEILPVDPARVPLDLPLLRAGLAAGEDRRITSATVRTALAETGRIAELDPALAARISEVRASVGGMLRLTLTAPHAEVVLPAGADSQRLRQLRATVEDVERRMARDSTVRGTPARIDARFQDQVVVRLPAAPSSATR